METGRCDKARQLGRVLVTGATGFLGLEVVRRLRWEGYEITAVARGLSQTDGIEMMQVDLAAENAPHTFSPWRWDAVVTLAGTIAQTTETFAAGADIIASNTRIALNVARSLPHEFRGRLIHASSMMVYGTPLCCPVDEDHPKKPTTCYGLGKLLAEDVISTACNDVWIMRLPGLFAPWRQSGAVTSFARAAVAGRDVHVQASEPTPWDILDVRDAAEAIARALRSPHRCPGPLNVSYGEPVELVRVARCIVDLAGTGVSVRTTAGVTHPILQLDIRRAQRLFDWPPARLSDRLDEVIQTHRPTSAA